MINSDPMFSRSRFRSCLFSFACSCSVLPPDVDGFAKAFKKGPISVSSSITRSIVSSKAFARVESSFADAVSKSVNVLKILPARSFGFPLFLARFKSFSEIKQVWSVVDFFSNLSCPSFVVSIPLSMVAFLREEKLQ